MKFGCLFSFFRCFVVNINSYSVDKNGRPLDMVILEKSDWPLSLTGKLIRLLKSKIIKPFVKAIWPKFAYCIIHFLFYTRYELLFFLWSIVLYIMVINKFQHGYFIVYSNYNFFVSGIMGFFRLITAFLNNKQTNW